MQLYFLGVSYEYYEYHLSQREVTPQSVQMLRYRGVPYMQVSHLAPDELALK
ncbi:DUF4278 domain-containing protein [Leptolyngbya sp. FACHB-671]|uniref:DUF4278 domain-containing protein n=1 Tax=Leptolyngbya sp. FACHB-671 TaxID=2692812 RepID=UPI0016880245|nr:DUF4278 domain-containing protein [Leptolyngbya sp. FACHB-671]